MRPISIGSFEKGTAYLLVKSKGGKGRRIRDMGSDQENWTSRGRKCDQVCRK